MRPTLHKPSRKRLLVLRCEQFEVGLFGVSFLPPLVACHIHNALRPPDSIRQLNQTDFRRVATKHTARRTEKPRWPVLRQDGGRPPFMETGRVVTLKEY